MAQAARAHEPTMEEILASIRRIIADEDISAPAPSTSPLPSDTAKPEMPDPAVPARSHGPGGSSSESGAAFADAPHQPPQHQGRTSGRPAGEALLSQMAAAAVEAAFDRLSHAAQMRNTRTLEAVVGDMLRPMLKSWLDENLPALVERLVRAEIERISRGCG
jgi:uncharacterized protein